MTTKTPRAVATATVSRSAADALITAAIAAATDIGIEVAVAIVDSGGALKAFARTDRAPFLTVDVAIDKSWTAASYGLPTHVWNDYIADPKVKPLAYLPRMMAVGGGYPLRDGGILVGGIGVSGGSAEQDQQIVAAAMRASGFETESASQN